MRRAFLVVVVALALTITLAIATSGEPWTLKHLVEFEATRPHFNPNDPESGPPP